MLPTAPSPPLMGEFVAKFAEHLRAFQGRAERTAVTYAAIATTFLEWIGQRLPERRDVEQFLSRTLKSGRYAAPSTRNQALAAVRALSRFAVTEGWWAQDPTSSIRFLREAPREPAVLGVAEVHRFFRAVQGVSPPTLRSRDRAMLGVLFTLGLRVHELVGLDADQVDLADGGTLVSLRGKGGTVSDLPVQATTMILLDRWLRDRPTLAKASERALFVSTRGTRVSVRSVQRLFEQLRSSVGTRKHVSPHSARHTFVTVGSQRGAEITALASVARHRNLNTTRAYLHLGGAERRRVVELVGVVIPHDVTEGVQDDSASVEMPATVGRGAETYTDQTQPEQLSLLTALSQKAANDSLDVQQPLADTTSFKPDIRPMPRQDDTAAKH